MDLVKLIEELRAYRAQVEAAIAAMEELARHRELSGSGRKQPLEEAGESGAAKARKPRTKLPAKFASKSAHMRPRLVKPKPRRPGGKSS